MDKSLGFKKTSDSKRITAGHDVIEALISSSAELKDAVADLVDNSIDAKAKKVEIRIHRLGSKNADGNIRLSISIWDNGKGMTKEELESAVALSDTSPKSEDRLGKFGVGLKASSFSNSVSTTIFTRGVGGSISGMELSGGPNERMSTPIRETDQGSGFKRSGALVPETGTIVRWEHLKRISKLENQHEVNTWVSKTHRTLSRHLGLTFHNFIKSEKNPDGVQITIRELNEDLGEGLEQAIRPIDPLDIPKNGSEKVLLSSSFRNLALRPVLVVLPKGVSDVDLEEATKSKNGSGFYFYRNGRVIQSGIWDALLQKGNRDWRLCRVILDIPVELEKTGDFTVSHDKNSCTFSDGLRDAILASMEEETKKSLSSFLRLAEARQKAKNAVEASAPKMPLVTGILEEELSPLIRDLCQIVGTPINVSFVTFPEDSKDIFKLDPKHAKLSFNSKIRGIANRNMILVAVIIGLREYLLRGNLNPKHVSHLKTWNEILWEINFEE